MRPTPPALITLLLVALLSGAGAGCTKAARRSRALARAERDFQAERYDDAEIGYKDVLRIQQEMRMPAPRTYGRLGMIYFKEGRLRESFQFLAYAAEHDPTNSDVRVCLSQVYLSDRNYEKARDMAIKVLAEDPGNDQALMLAARSTLSNALPASMKAFASLPPFAKEKPVYHAALGVLDLVQGDLAKAEEEIQRAIALDPKLGAAHEAMASLRSRQKDLKQAGQELRMAADLAPIRSPLRIEYAQFELDYARYKLRLDAAESETNRLGQTSFDLGSSESITNQAFISALGGAKAYVLDIAKKAPDYIPAWLFLAKVALDEKKPDDALECVGRILGRSPFDYAALNLKSRILETKGDLPGAIATLERMASVYKGNPEVQLNLGQAYALNREWAKAISSYEAAIRPPNTNYTPAIFALARLQVLTRNPVPAISSLNRMLRGLPTPPPKEALQLILEVDSLLVQAYSLQRDLDDAIGTCAQMISLLPTNPAVHVLMGQLLNGQSKPADARKEFEAAMQLSDDRNLDAHFLDALVGLISLDLAEGQFGKPIDRVQKLAAKFPKEAALPFLLARIHREHAFALRDAERKKRGAAGASLALADIPAARAELTQSETPLLKAIDLNPNLEAAYTYLADVYVANGEHKQAIDHLASFLVRTNDATVHVELGKIYDALTNYPSARDEYEKALAVRPEFPVALNNLAWVYSEHLGNLDKALNLAERANRLHPEDPGTADTLGWILCQRGDYDKALPLLWDSSLKLPLQYEIQFHLGQTYYMLGDEGRARNALEAALEPKRDFKGKDEAGRRLAMLNLDLNDAGPAARATINQFLKENPGDPVASMRLGTLLERDKAFDQAVAVYQRARKVSPQNAPIQARLALLSATYLKDLHAALELGKRAHDLAPDDPEVTYALGKVVFLSGDYPYAATLLQESVPKLSKNPDALYDLAWSFYSVGQVALAESSLESALAAGPALSQAPEAKTFLSFLTAAKTDAQSPQTVADAERTLKTNENYVPALMVVALAAQQKANETEAERIYQRVLAVYPLFLPATKNLVRLYAQHPDQTAKAYTIASSAREARESFPDDPDLARLCAVLGCRQGDFARVLPLLEEGVRTRNQDAELFYYLGKAQIGVKQLRQARQSFQNALALNSLEPKLAQDAQRTLKDLK